MDTQYEDVLLQQSQKKKKKWGIWLAVLILLSAVLALIVTRTAEDSSSYQTLGNGQPTWAIYIYLCGADLETDCGSASENMAEIYPDEMPSNLTFVIESGGAKEWNNYAFSADCLQYWTITADEGLVKRKELPQGNMGEQQTLQDFLQFCKDEYPADKTMLILWDHGGGPVFGCCWDENYPGTKSLQTKEVAAALEATFGSDASNPPIDIVDYDCCLMAGVDVAQVLQGKASYLIASQETVAGTGQDYGGFVSAIADDPGISPLEFGKTVITNFARKYSPNGEKTDQTLSMTDLSEIGNVSDKLNAFCGEVISEIYANPSIFSTLASHANQAEFYGAHSRTADNYTNLVDISDFVRHAGDNLSSGQDLIDALDHAVVAKFNGYYHKDSSGLSMFYSYNGDSLETYLEQGASTGVKSLNELHVEEKLSGEQNTFVANLGLNADAVPDIKTFDTLNYVDTSVRKNQNGQYYVDFGPEAGTAMTNVLARLYCIREDDVCVLGTDDEVEVDWNEGIIINNFGGRWLQIGGLIAYADLTLDSDEYNIYSIPVMFPEDEEWYSLQMVYNFETSEWGSLGVIRAGDNPGECSKLEVPDGQELRLFQAFLEEDADGNIFNQPYEIGSAYYSDDVVCYDSLPDGNYAMELLAEDVHKDLLTSDFIYFSIVDGEIYYY